MHAYTPANSGVFDGPVTNLLSILSVEVLSRAHTKRVKKRLNDFKFGTSTGRERGVKGLKELHGLALQNRVLFIEEEKKEVQITSWKLNGTGN